MKFARFAEVVSVCVACRAGSRETGDRAVPGLGCEIDCGLADLHHYSIAVGDDDVVDICLCFSIFSAALL